MYKLLPLLGILLLFDCNVYVVLYFEMDHTEFFELERE